MRGTDFNGQTASSRAREPYEPPRVTFRERLEAVAIVCSPAPPAKATIAVCRQGPISS